MYRHPASTVGYDVGYSEVEAGRRYPSGRVWVSRHWNAMSPSSRAMYGSDQAASIEPAGFRSLVGAVRKIQSGQR